MKHTNLEIDTPSPALVHDERRSAMYVATAYVSVLLCGSVVGWSTCCEQMCRTSVGHSRWLLGRGQVKGQQNREEKLRNRSMKWQGFRGARVIPPTTRRT